MKNFRLSLFSGNVRISEDVIFAEDKKEAIAIAIDSMRAEEGLYDKKLYKFVSINWKGGGIAKLNKNEYLDMGDYPYYYSTCLGEALFVRISEMI